MAIIKMDPTPYLMDGESVVLKAHAQKNKLAAVEVFLCYVFWLLAICGDCFVIASAFGMKQYDVLQSGYLAVVLPLFLVHLIPFIFWVVYAIRKMNKKSDKWYALTEKRLLIVQDKKPSVVTFVDFGDITALAANSRSVTIYMNEERIKLDGLEDVTAFADRLELLAFGEEDEKQRVSASRPKKEKKN